MQGGGGTGPGPKWSHDPWYKAQILCWDDKPRRVPSQERKNEFLFSGEVMGGKEGPGDEGWLVRGKSAAKGRGKRAVSVMQIAGKTR